MEIERQPYYCFCDKVMIVLKCIFRNCFENERDNTGAIIPRLVSIPSSNRIIGRSGENEDEDNSQDVVAIENSRYQANQNEARSSPIPFFSFFNRFQMSKESVTRFLPLNNIVGDGSSSITELSNDEMRSSSSNLIRRKSASIGHQNKCILKEAKTFEYDIDKEVPTIDQNEIILPGSEIQLKMAMAMKENLMHCNDECVICMDVFTPENPRMPTLCGCGENKTYFHLPCLYQWIEENRNCPSCRKPLRWEEF